MPRGAWATALLLVVTGATAPTRAQPLAPSGGPPPDSASASESLPPPASPATARRAAPDHPPPILGAPIAVPGLPVRAEDRVPERPAVAAVPASFTDAPAPKTGKQPRGVGLGRPVSNTDGVTLASAPIPASAVDAPVRPAGGTDPASDPVNDFLTRRTGKTDPAKGDPPADDRPVARKSGKFGDRISGILGEHGDWFKSDHVFDGFISPVTNPFLFEDPRSLTEVRPIFLYQKMPGSQPDFQGGNISYFGVQGRVAFTDRLSFVVNKLGGIWVNPGGNSAFGGESGFAEIWFGPKYTFIRNPDTGTLLAGGLQFQLPVGSSGPFQNTGSLSLVPYVSYGQNLFRDFALGSVNTMASGGYSFSTNSARSDYLYLSGHIDLDVLNCHKFYPLFEMNYFLTTTNGTANPLIGVEGRDLINFGAQAKGHGLLTGAFGARYKITENAQVGGAFEIPFAGPRDLFNYRFTLDFILRY